MTNFQKIISDIVAKDPLRQIGVAEKLGVTDAYVSNFVTGTRKLSKKIALKLEEVYGLNSTEMLSIQKREEADQMVGLTDKKADALEQLKKVTNGKNIKPKSETIFHTLEAYVLPVKGRLGLGSTYYADSYFEDKLEKTTVSVTEKPTNANRIILAEFEGDSMTDGSHEQIPDGSWVILAERKRGEDWDANMEGKIMGFFDKDDNFTIKKVKKHDKHFKYVILEALNPDKSIEDNQDRELQIKNCWAIYDYINKLS
ncbi:helix-turn-helix domain-containing protein [Chryseobacterium manosquense]|uniref:Helix-turn-helix domain-containing protein n=1 Tax=Chryseobacterium manosquense TaxID=2754694 RepID=A0A7H1DT33_9FLAO|nr:helix-turn-helix domain-containing protein [Chryseobacterium manosquense]QNS40141.1 helix-turn-helix domain-containing protein [Chryseobacterium manosquense]